MKTVKCKCCDGSGTHAVPRNLIDKLYEDRSLTIEEAESLARVLSEGCAAIREGATSTTRSAGLERGVPITFIQCDCRETDRSKRQWLTVTACHTG